MVVGILSAGRGGGREQTTRMYIDLGTIVIPGANDCSKSYRGEMLTLYFLCTGSATIPSDGSCRSVGPLCGRD